MGAFAPSSVVEVRLYEHSTSARTLVFAFQGVADVNTPGKTSNWPLSVDSVDDVFCFFVSVPASEGYHGDCDDRYDCD